MQVENSKLETSSSCLCNFNSRIFYRHCGFVQSRYLLSENIADFRRYAALQGYEITATRNRKEEIHTDPPG
jgi:hypothetical protein